MPAEVSRCNDYLAAEIVRVPPQGAILALGRIAHEAALRAAGHKPSTHRFAHGARFDLDRGVALFDSYHCSRYNTSTRRLTPAMFDAVIAGIGRHLGRVPGAEVA
jgi:uracil-DNA glycosylase